MKAALIALALLATPATATATTIEVNLYPAILQGEHPDLYFLLVQDAFYGNIPGCRAPCIPSMHISDDFEFFQASVWAANGNDYTIDFHYFSAPPVPEPATWALLLIGFAFFALKNIWPNSPENDH